MPEVDRNKNFCKILLPVTHSDLEVQSDMVCALSRSVDALPEADQRNNAAQQIFSYLQNSLTSMPSAAMKQITHMIVAHTPADTDLARVDNLKSVLQNGLEACANSADISATTAVNSSEPSLIDSMQKLLVFAADLSREHAETVLFSIVSEFPALLKKGIVKQSTMLIVRRLTACTVEKRDELLSDLRNTLKALESDLQMRWRQSPASEEVIRLKALVEDAKSLVPLAKPAAIC